MCVRFILPAVMMFFIMFVNLGSSESSMVVANRSFHNTSFVHDQLMAGMKDGEDTVNASSDAPSIIQQLLSRFERYSSLTEARGSLEVERLMKELNGMYLSVFALMWGMRMNNGYNTILSAMICTAVLVAQSIDMPFLIVDDLSLLSQLAMPTMWVIEISIVVRAWVLLYHR